MSDFARFLCAEYRAGNLTATQVHRYVTRGKITPEEESCILDPDCPCEWTTAAQAADGEAAPEA